MVTGHKHIVTNKYTWNNGLLYFKNGFNESLEPYYNIMYQSIVMVLPYSFHQSVLLFPNILHLEVHHVSDPILLTYNIQCLNIQTFYMHELKLPSGLKSLYIYNSAYVLELNKYICVLSIKDTYKCMMLLNKTMHQITLSYHFDSLLILNKKLDSVSVGCSFNQLLELPKYLSQLSIGYSFDKKILLPRYISYLRIECQKTKNIVLDGGIVDRLNILVYTKDCYIMDNLPDKIILSRGVECSTNNLPKNYIVKHFL